MKDLDDYLYSFLRSAPLNDNLNNVEFGVSTTYMLERLVIVHCRLWHLEDKIRLTDNDQERSNIKRQIDFLNSKIRPRLIQAIGDSIIKACQSKDMTVIAENNMKYYGDEK